jgi:hypothetical protein
LFGAFASFLEALENENVKTQFEENFLEILPKITKNQKQKLFFFCIKINEKNLL